MQNCVRNFFRSPAPHLLRRRRRRPLDDDPELVGRDPVIDDRLPEPERVVLVEPAVLHHLQPAGRQAPHAERLARQEGDARPAGRDERQRRGRVELGLERQLAPRPTPHRLKHGGHGDDGWLAGQGGDARPARRDERQRRGRVELGLERQLGPRPTPHRLKHGGHGDDGWLARQKGDAWSPVDHLEAVEVRVEDRFICLRRYPPGSH